MLPILRALPLDAPQLKAIALTPKGHWGYPESLLEQWAQSGIISPEEIATQLVYKVCAGETAVAWTRLLVPRNQPAFLEDLWVQPAWMGQGLGRQLFQHAAFLAQNHGAQALELDADPHAVPFYQRLGCVIIGESLTMWGRMVPRLHIALSAQH